MIFDIDTLQRVWGLMRSSIADPASNPVAAVMALAILATVLLLLVVLLAIALSRRSHGAEEGDELSELEALQQDSEGRSVLVQRIWRRRVAGVLIALAVVTLLVLGLGYTSTDSFCARCHSTERAFEAREEGAHAGVSCSACHEAGSLSGYVDAKSRGLENLYSEWAQRVGEGPFPSVVSDAACLNCHREIVEKTVVARSIRIRHFEVLESGYKCIDCHNTEAHGYDVARPRYPEMRYCILCHDGKTAPASCETCHPDDAGSAVRRSRRMFPKVNVVKEDCRGCHSVQPCIDCHGLELPHSRRFVSAYHARSAYADLDTCLSCHDLDVFCNDRCHNFAVERVASGDGLHRTGEEHGVGFLSRHATSGKDYCAQCHGDLICDYCHGEIPEH